jgi:hypothetical protein
MVPKKEKLRPTWSATPCRHVHVTSAWARILVSRFLAWKKTMKFENEPFIKLQSLSFTGFNDIGFVV